jgi:hypothetical protein
MAPDIAVMFVDAPAATPNATPVVVMVAVPVEALSQVTLVSVWVLPSEKWPVAVKTAVPPTGIVSVAGVTVMVCRFTPVAVTVKSAPVAGLVIAVAASLAVMYEVPIATPVASPPELVIVAAAVVADVQVTVAVMSFVLASLYVPVALYCWVAPTATDAAAGVTAIETSVTAGVTVKTAPVGGLKTVPNVAVISEVPALTAVARPPAEIVAIEAVPEAQVTWLVMFCVGPLV